MDMMYEDDELPEDEEEDEEEEEGVEIENEYYNAKGMVEEDLETAIEGFEKVVELEEEKGEWGFKALKKLVKLYFQKGNNKKVAERFKKFMEYTKSAVTNNYSEKGINSILDTVGAGKDLILTEEIYNLALSSLKQYNNEVMTIVNVEVLTIWNSESVV
jgi:COP9 signalosome complex subunit 2